MDQSRVSTLQSMQLDVILNSGLSIELELYTCITICSHDNVYMKKLNSSDCIAIGLTISKSDCQDIHLRLNQCSLGSDEAAMLAQTIANCNNILELKYVS